jgi:hypothetical protein
MTGLMPKLSQFWTSIMLLKKSSSHLLRGCSYLLNTAYPLLRLNPYIARDQKRKRIIYENSFYSKLLANFIGESDYTS